MIPKIIHYYWFGRNPLSELAQKYIASWRKILPDLDEFHELLKEIRTSKWVINMGQFHKKLEQALCEYLKVPYISLFTNGTLPLLTALQVLRITGEVVTIQTNSIFLPHIKVGNE